VAARDVSGRSRARQAAKVAAAAVGITIGAVWDEVFFATPVLWTTARQGPWLTLSVLVPVYILFATGVSWLLVGGKEMKYAKSGKIERFVAKAVAHGEDGRIRKRLAAGSAIGFFLSAWLIGGIQTSFIMRVLGVKRHTMRWSVGANTIWAIMFVGQYTGIAAIIF
jgi:hypothetical protein